MQDFIIPARLDVIATARKMMEVGKQYSSFSTTELMIRINDGTQISAHQAKLMTFTDPIIECAILYCRCLLDFVGLGIDKKATHPTLKQRSPTRQKGDIGIEHFSAGTVPAKQLSPNDAAALLSENATDLKLAWATVIAIANHRLAHSTDDQMLTGTNTKSLQELALKTVPELVCRAFYDQIGAPRPPF